LGVGARTVKAMANKIEQGLERQKDYNPFLRIHQVRSFSADTALYPTGGVPDWMNNHYFIRGDIW